MRKIPRVMAIILIISLMLAFQISLVSAQSGAAQLNRHIAVKAENVEIVKKATLKGAPAKAVKGAGSASTGIIGAALPAGGTKYAIVIGISDYPGSGSDLQYADDDAAAVTTVLKQYGFNVIILLENSAANGTRIMNEIDNLKAKLNEKDELVFFFSGHGAKGWADDGDKNSQDQCIVAWNTTKDADGFDYIWDGELKQWFTGFKTSRIIFAFDSCLSGGMSVLNSPGRVVNMGSTATSYSYEGSQWGGGHGQFTYYFMMEGLGEGKADLSGNKDGSATVEEAFDFAKANCSFQKPTIADGFTNDLYLD